MKAVGSPLRKIEAPVGSLSIWSDVVARDALSETAWAREDSPVHHAPPISASAPAIAAAAIAPTASPYVIFRTIGYFPEDVNHRNPAAMLISDQPTRNYATCLFGEGGCIVGNPTSTGMLPVLLHVYSKDAEGGIPTVVLDTLKPIDAGAPASDAVIDPSYVTKKVVYDRFGYPLTEWSFLVWVRQSSTKERRYWVRFKAPDAKLECTLTVDPW